MKYDFTSVPDRSKCGSTKWNGCKNASTENVPLSVADMEFFAAPAITEAIKSVADTAVLGYTGPTDDYYDAVCDWQARRHDFHIERDWILTTPGVVNALAVVIDAVTKPGDGVLILTPVYYPFDMSALCKSRRVVYSELINCNGYYAIDYNDLERKAKRSDVTAILFCNPHNPVGRVWTEEELKKVCDICCDNGVFIIDDEIHNDLIMPGYKHTVMANVSERAKDNMAVCTAPSKTFNIAGLQCSNIIIPNKLARMKAFACASFNMQTTLNIFAYAACTAAYTKCEDWLEEAIEVIDGNAKYIKSFMAENFPEVKMSPLEGTYLPWLDMRGLGMSHTELKKVLLDSNIYLDNGEMFGDAGRGFQRINIACARETLEKAMARFKEGVDRARAGWENTGKPYHEKISVGNTLKNFVYDSVNGCNIDLAENISKPTLIVFARFFTCDITQALLKAFKGIYSVMKLRGCDLKFVIQSDIDEISDAQNKYPFELIADPNAKLYEMYNVFEKSSFVQMIAGDKLIEKMIGKDVKKLLDSKLFESLSDAMVAAVSGGGEKTDGKRDLQVCAFAAVDKDMKVTYSHYCKTIADIPKPLEMIKGLRG